MKRRDFVRAAGLSMTLPLGAALTGGVAAGQGGRHYYELRKYSLLNRTKQKPLDDFLEGAAIPALNRIGVGPIGVFNLAYGQNEPTVYVLMPHESLESVVTAQAKLSGDAAYMKSGAAFLNAPISEPAFLRMENSLLLAFEGLPRLQPPKELAGKPRIFELRIYESHSAKAGKKKIEMFNQGGEIEIFKKTGLNPVFFGETLIGRRLPNLHYMLAFPDMAVRDRQWQVFGEDPGWLRLREMTEYADTVSNITDIILRPAPYSQV